MRRLCCCVEELFTLLSAGSKMPVCVGAPGTRRTEEFTVPNAQNPPGCADPSPAASERAAESPAPGCAAEPGRVVPGICILSSACLAPARVARSGLRNQKRTLEMLTLAGSVARSRRSLSGSTRSLPGKGLHELPAAQRWIWENWLSAVGPADMEVKEQDTEFPALGSLSHRQKGVGLQQFIFKARFP